jgi:hypothetical protein
MPAIVRQTMGRSLARSLLTDIQTSSNEYYIGIGKSDLFNQEDTVISLSTLHLKKESFVTTYNQSRK